MEFIKKNQWYIGIGITIFIVLLALGGYFLFRTHSITYTPLTASDGSFQINFPSHIHYQVNQTENNQFVIDLSATKDNLFFYATTIKKSRTIDLYQVVKKDKENDLKNRHNIREDSGLIPFNLSTYKGYEYHYIYSDNSYGKDFYCNVVWIETDKNLYVLNMEVLQDSTEKYQDIFSTIKNSFIEL